MKKISTIPDYFCLVDSYGGYYSNGYAKNHDSTCFFYFGFSCTNIYCDVFFTRNCDYRCFGYNIWLLFDHTSNYCAACIISFDFCCDWFLVFAKETRNRFKNGQFTLANWRFQSFNFVIGIIHSIAEMLVVSVFFFVGNMPETYYSEGYFYTVFILMGIGGLIHSLVDYNIAYFVAGTLSKYFDIPVFTKAKQVSQKTPSTKSIKKMA